MEDDKPFACSFSGCKMRFTNEDHLTVHKKKHDMVLNFDKGEKANIFVADQTPTPTRFIRNCEEVGLFQDLQNVNPFEETFRKAVEAVKSGTGALHEMETLTVNTGADDSLHTPHVFPHIIEDSTSSNSSTFKTATTPVISSTSVIIGSTGKKSGLICVNSTSPNERRELDQLLHPTSTTGDENCPSEAILEERRIISTAHSKVIERRVVRQEADTSQQRSSREVITASADKRVMGTPSLSTEPAVATTPGGNTVQLLLRMPDGKLLQLSALPFEQVTPGTNNNVQTSQVAVSQPESTQNPTVLLTTPVPLTQSTNNKKEVAAAKQSSVLSPGKLKLKQKLTSINRTPTVNQESSLPKQPIPKITTSEPKQIIPSSKPESEVPARRMSSSNSSASNNAEDPIEKRERFLARNRAAAMRCREKRKTWIQLLERRADEMQRINQQLQSEVSSLRAEVASLKTLLLAHKDCPVTQAMAQGANVEVPPGSHISPPQIVVSMPIAQNSIVVDGSQGLKRVASEPPITPMKKLLNVTTGSPIIRQALLIPSNQGSVQVINNSTSAGKTVQSTKISNSLAPASTVQPGVLVTNPIITIPVTVPGNPVPLSAVMPNSYQQSVLPETDNHNESKMVDCEVTTHVIKVNPNVLQKGEEKQTLPLGSEDDSDIEIISDAKSRKR